MKEARLVKQVEVLSGRSAEDSAEIAEKDVEIAEMTAAISDKDSQLARLKQKLVEAKISY